MEADRDLLKLENEYRLEVRNLYKEKPVMKFEAGQSCSNLKERVSKLLEKTAGTQDSSSTESPDSSQQSSQVEMDIYLVKEDGKES